SFNGYSNGGGHRNGYSGGAGGGGYGGGYGGGGGWNDDKMGNLGGGLKAVDWSRQNPDRRIGQRLAENERIFHQSPLETDYNWVKKDTRWH
ncbi:hypothetical protein MPER_08971, partial [Moniliophthora perniciosa FA553]